MAELRRSTVLSVTRDMATRELIEETLDEPGTEIVFVSDLREFFEIIARDDIDLVIYDTKMPSLNALDAFAVSKTYNPDTPSILVTDHEAFDAMSSILEKGFVYRTSKPLDRRYLKEIYNALCRRKSGIYKQEQKPNDISY